MKKLLSLLTLFFSFPALANSYFLTIEGQTFEVPMNKEFIMEINGEKTTMKIEQKENIVFAEESFSFEHPSKYTPETQDLGSGIFQTVMMTPLGTTIIIQEYTTISPMLAMDYMIEDITEEERGFGFNITSEPSFISLKDGKKLLGKAIESKQGNTHIKRKVYVYGSKNSGLLVITQYDRELAGDEYKIIKQFFNSLVINMD